ncbi:BTAD domain-containing putative transcriptional regulator [Oscillatoria sp. CS-180]|uniref:BTAD domain-containing putative transcriptional regulator n=1 Tax=Oscillatoria sp. CS-180 TaxID=3021720 RepID=UPI00232CE8FD|nr:BTAD domain-containing putative transcriptional regulator [Oscillatoria sp. CS-180]MDB9529359.1 BTAD domain-containing putative transcriptional regulator [Oscillatoria sp. CS-180]
MRSSRQLCINLLGHFQLIFEEQSVAGLQTERYQSMVAYLILNAQTPQPRSRMATVFWPNVSEAQAKASLRRELFRLRQVLPEADRILQITSTTLQWQPQLTVWLDVAEFESTLQAAQQTENPQTQVVTLKQAIALYQGDLLPTCYGDWILPERERLFQLFIQALSDLCHLAVYLSDVHSGMDYGQQLIQHEPLSEVGYLTLMKVYALQGDRPAALQVYHQCMTLLREELGIDPSAETRQFYEHLLADEITVSPPAPNRPEPPESTAAPDSVEPKATPSSTNQIDWGGAPDIQFFYGRLEEATQLQRWIQQDHCRLVAILGIGGIGKTFLAAKVTYDLQTDFNFIVWRSLRNAPPLDDLLEDLIPFISSQEEMSYSITRLIHWLRQSRCLIILDNVETLFKGGEKAGQYRDGYENYGELFSVTGQANHSSCLILTSREKPPEVATFVDTNPAVRSLQLDGSPEVALALVDSKQLVGTQAEKEQLCERCDHSPLSLQIVSSSIQDIFAGDIALFLEEDVVLFNEAKRLLELQFKRLSALEKTVMTWLAINRDWTSLAELKTDIYPVCATARLLEALESLCWRSLIQRRGNTYTQQSVIMEYVIESLIDQVSNELSNSACFAAQPNSALAVVAFPLLKTTVKDFIREGQERLILAPIAEQLKQSLVAPETAIHHHLKTLQSNQDTFTGYSAGNLINLIWALNINFTGLDLSGLTIYQAYLQHVSLHQVNFNRATFRDVVFNQPFDPVCSMAFSRDGSLLATGDGGGRIVIWRITDQKPILTFKGSTSWVVDLDFSYDGRQLVSEGSNVLNVWDVTSGQLLKTLEGHTSLVWTVAASPTENVVVSGSVDTHLILWDLDTGEPIHRLVGHTQQINAAVFNPDGTQIVSASVDKTLRFWNVRTGETVKNWPCDAEPQCISFSPDGYHLAVGQYDGTMSLWNLQTEQIEWTLPAHQSQISSLAFSPCGNYLASGGVDAVTKLWNPKTGQLLRVTTVYINSIWRLAFSPNGQYLVVSSNDPTIRLWEMPKKRLYKTLQGCSSWVTAIRFHPDEPVLLSGSGDCKVRLWNAATGELIETLAGQRDWILNVAVSPCGQTIASGSNDGTIYVWDMSTGQLCHKLLGHDAPVWSVEFSPEGQQLVSSSFDQTIRLWDVTTGQAKKVIQAHKGWVFDTQFSPDGKQFASTGMDGLIKLWNAETAALIRAWQSQQSSTWGLTFSADSRCLATGGEDKAVKLWSAETSELLRTFEGHTAGVWVIESSPNGSLLASGSDDQTIKLWDINTGQLLQTFDLHQGRINALAFTPDSQTLASGSSDETIRLWNVSSGDCLMTLRAPRPYEAMTITDVQGLTEAQIESLKALGAIAD